MSKTSDKMRIRRKKLSNRGKPFRKTTTKTILENCWTPRKNTRSIVSRLNTGNGSKIMNFTTAVHKIWVRNIVNKINDSLKTLFLSSFLKRSPYSTSEPNLFIIFHKTYVRKWSVKSKADLQSSCALKPLDCKEDPRGYDWN